MRYVHTNIVAQDWQRLAGFYTEVFACTPLLPERNLQGEWLERGTGVEAASVRGVHLRLPGCSEEGPTLEIVTYSRIEPGGADVANRQGFAHIAFAVDDVEAVVSKLEAQGGSLAGEITSKEIPGVGVVTFVYAKDPEGNLVELQSWG